MFFQYSVIGVAVILFFYFPGLAFKKFYFYGPYSKQYGWGNLQTKFFTGLLAGIFVHVIILCAYCAIKKVVSGNYDPLQSFYNTLLDQISDSIRERNIFLPFDESVYILGYWIVTLFASAVLGRICCWLVLALGLDLKFKVFRFANHWHYYFRGRILNEKSYKGFSDQTHRATQADVLVGSADGNILYTGLLSNYELSHRECKLEAIYLEDWMRYSKTSNGFKDEPGEFLTIPFDKIFNINLRYIYKAKKEGGKNWPTIRKILRSAFYIATIVFSLALPIGRYSKIGVLNVLLAIILGLANSMIVIVLLGFFKKKIRTTYREQTLIIVIVASIAIIIFTIVILKLLRLIPF